MDFSLFRACNTHCVSSYLYHHVFVTAKLTKGIYWKPINNLHVVVLKSITSAVLKPLELLRLLTDCYVKIWKFTGSTSPSCDSLHLNVTVNWVGALLKQNKTKQKIQWTWSWEIKLREEKVLMYLINSSGNLHEPQEKLTLYSFNQILVIWRTCGKVMWAVL